jgi:hypothetical protein
MNCHLLLRGTLATLVGLGALGAARTAAADPTPCSEDSDCTKGFSCQAIGATACAGVACPLETGETDAQACPPTPVCDPQVIKGCMPGPCSMNSDCATGMVCYANSYTNCPAPEPLPSCPPNADCAEPAFDGGMCTTTTVKSCVPQYDLPCTIDSDCGDGFTCVPDTTTACSGGGSAGSGGVGGLPASPPSSPPVELLDAGTVGVGAIDGSSPPPSCTTTTGPGSSCQAKTIPCASVTDCPPTWTCVAQAQPVSNVCVGPVSLDGGAVSCGAPDPGPTQMLCQPPYTDLGPASAGGTLSGTGSAPLPATASNGATANGGTGGSSVAPAGESGGCQVGTPGSSSRGIPLVALLGLAAMFRRRRSRTSASSKA